MRKRAFTGIYECLEKRPIFDKLEKPPKDTCSIFETGCYEAHHTKSSILTKLEPYLLPRGVVPNTST